MERVDITWWKHTAVWRQNYMQYQTCNQMVQSSNKAGKKEMLFPFIQSVASQSA